MQVFLTAVRGRIGTLLANIKAKEIVVPKCPWYKRHMWKIVLLRVLPPLGATHCSQRVCSLSLQWVDIKYLEVLWQNGEPCIHLPSLWCLSSKEKESKHKSLAHVRGSTDCASLPGHARAREWCVFSMCYSIMTTWIFHYGFSSRVVFIYISSFL